MKINEKTEIHSMFQKYFTYIKTTSANAR